MRAQFLVPNTHIHGIHIGEAWVKSLLLKRKYKNTYYGVLVAVNNSKQRGSFVFHFASTSTHIYH